MSFIRLAVTRPVTVWMLTLAAVVFGLTSLGRLDLRLLPEIRYPTLTLQTDFPGTAPVDVENLVTRPIEEAVGVVPGLRRVHSVSQAGLSQVTLQFDWGTDMDYAALDVREKVDLVRLPDDAAVPLLLKYDPGQDPVLRIGLSGGTSLVTLRRLADDVLKQEIEGLPGVAAAQVDGGLEEEIRVEVDEAKLSALGVDIAAIGRVVGEENVNASGGRLRDRNAEYIVRTLSRFESLDDIGQVTVANVAGRPVKLAEVATVTRTHKDRTSITHIDGQESVEIAVYREGDANAVEMARAVRAHLDRLRGELPAPMRLEVLFDQSVFIADAVKEVRDNALLGGLLAVLVLFVFLGDFKGTLIIALAIPVSIVATFILMLSRGVTLNIMSLGGLALGVGMLVDNSIVVLEAIHRRREQRLDPDVAESAVRGAAEVAGAVTASTLTTLAVFVPIVFVVVGVAGQIFRDQALTVSFSLAVSLLVSLTFTPMAAGRGGGGVRAGAGAIAGWKPAEGVTGRRFSRWLKLAGLAIAFGLPRVLAFAGGKVLRAVGAALRLLMRPLTSGFARGFPVVVSGYDRTLVWALRRKLAIGVATLAFAAGGVLLWPRLGTELVPPLAQGELTLALELPEGTPLSRTASIVGQIEEGLRALPEVALVAGEIGIARDGQAGLVRRKENRAELQVRLAGTGAVAEGRALESMRGVIAAHPEVHMRVQRQSLLNFGSPVEVNVAGWNLDDLQKTADQVAERLRDTPGLRDVRQSLVPGSPEVQVSFDRDKLNRHGLSLGAVSETVRGKLRGTVATRYRDRENHVDIRVLNESEQRSTLTAVEDLIVAEQDGVPVRLGSVATLGTAVGPAEIHRLGGKRVAIVGANLSGRDLGSVTRDVQERLADLPLPAGITVDMGGQNQEMAASYRSLKLAVLLAVFLVYLVMAAQFESFLYPLIIMFTVPLALSGAVYGLWLRGMSVSVIAVIGAIMLAGIVVNNGIVLVDRMNQLRRRLPLAEAVRESCRERLRPILMTTLTTVLGLLPMALGLGEGAELRAPLAVTVIAGLSLATLLTLVVVPVAYFALAGGAVPETAAGNAETVNAVAGAGRLAGSTAGKEA
ncbi:MAG: efflux RND transporter permease subunit [bacterium]|nr:efflux RND transporter permease subunit [bacterium]